jgi:hypothetical protein
MTAAVNYDSIFAALARTPTFSELFGGEESVGAASHARRLMRHPAALLGSPSERCHAETTSLAAITREAAI